MKGVAIIAAAGKGSRAGVDKMWIRQGDKTVLERATAPFFDSLSIDELVLVVSPDRVEEATRLFAGREKPCMVVAGGETRTESVRNALKRIAEGHVDQNVIVAVHDGARPFVTRRLIEECMSVAAEKGNAVPALPCVDSLRKKTEGGSVAIPRGDVVRVQTPQCFELAALLKAYSFGEEATDDATLYEKHVGEIVLVKGEEENRKITYLSDIFGDYNSRVGVGFDAHPLVDCRDLILGGVKIPFEKGLDGHSDADVLVHAIMDAMLTGAHLPDIGHIFPPSDPAYKGADSIVLLEKVTALLEERKYAVVNVSATIIAEAPKLAPYLPQMEKRVANAIKIPEESVKFAATTTEKLGIIGEGKGMASEAVALLIKKID